MGSVDHTFIKDEPNAVQAIEQVDGYIDDMKKGTSNILVNIYFHYPVLLLGRGQTQTPLVT